mgnify:CR=1 FL=1
MYCFSSLVSTGNVDGLDSHDLNASKNAIIAINTAIINGFNFLFKDKKKLGSWTEYLKLREVLIDAKKNFCRIGDFCNVKIYDATDFDLYGEVVA